MIRSTLFASLLIVVATPIRANGQPGHYDLGQKLRALELSWEQSDLEARRRALPVLRTVVPLLFADQKPAAARAFDQSRFLVQSAAEPSTERRWAASLVVRPSARLIDPADGALSVEVVAYYDPQVTRPEHAMLRWRIAQAGGAGKVKEEPILNLPARSSVSVADLPEGDYFIRAEIIVDGKPLARHEHLISAVPRLRERLRLLGRAEVGTSQSTEQLT